ncbi:MAG: alpha/beta hydrolase [Gammaproteobacteria bacterium]|nr:alpha/beta hydrolase [Gammaproteobacteria bacterium]
MMRLFFVVVLFNLLPAFAAAAPQCVLLLHGLSRSADSMSELEHKLAQAEFIPINIDYPSRKFPIEQLAEKAIAPSLKRCPPGSDISFVTHSMGGILVRQYLSEHKLENLKRVVMLGPPNRGSEVVDKLKNFPGFHFINGDAGLQLGTGKLSLPNQLGAAKFELGIIAGTRSINLILSSLIPGTNNSEIT